MQAENSNAFQSTHDLLRDVCDAPEVPDAIKVRARSALHRVFAPHDSDQLAARSGLTWWLQLEPAFDASSDGTVVGLYGNTKPKVWSAIAQGRSAAGRGCTEALVCYAMDEPSMRNAFAQRFGSHSANAAAVFPGIVINQVTASVITRDALRMMETLTERNQPFSLEARLESFRR